MISFKRLVVTSSLAVASASTLHAQGQKKVLTQADWDIWRSISATSLSPDGKWLSYNIQPLVGDGQLVIRSTSTSTEYTIQRGYVARPNNTPGGARPAAGGGAGAGGRGGGGGRGSGPFADNGKFVIESTQPGKAEVDSATRAAALAAASNRGGRGAGGAGGGANATTRSSLVILNLADGKQTVLPDVRTFRLSSDNGRYLVYNEPAQDSAATPADSANANAAGGGVGGGAGARGGRAGGAGGGGGARGAGRGAGGGRGASGRPAIGSTIVIRDLETGTEEKMADVVSYTFDDSARTMAYVIGSKDSTKDGVFLRSLANGAMTTVITGPANYRNFTFDQTGTQYAFLTDRDEHGQPKPRSSLYYGSVKGGTAAGVVVPAALPPAMHIADNSAVSFTRSGNALRFNIAPPPDDTVPADSLVGKAVYDLWNYKDPDLQPQQKLDINRDRNRTYEALYNLGTKKWMRLTDDSMTAMTVSDDAKTGLVSTSARYEIAKMWGDDGNDIYIVDLATGNRKLLKEKISGSASLSPDGHYVMMFDNGHWYSYNVASGKTVDVTGGIKGVAFDQSETWSTPDTPTAFAIAGWTRGEHDVLMYDRYDIWEIDPTGVRAPVMVTDSVGRKEHIVFRIIDFDRTDRFVDPNAPLLLSATNDETKASGFYRDRLGAKQLPEKIVMADVKYGAPVKAKNAEEYAVTKQTFTQYPDVYVGSTLTALTKVTDANPQQKDYNWGTAELVHWTSADGVPLAGILFKPENFDPGKKYPMITYFYEELSDGLNSYVAPNGRNIINPTHYVSNGYLVFEPDIHYETGYPGASAVKSIVPGIEMLLARGYVDPKKLGAQGHSWGGYQTAFLVTQTHLFAAAMAGAPVANMTSAYGGIRWGSGLARSFQYEKTQSRIGKSLWEAPQLYIENSPLFWLDRITTPLFIMSNDADDAVPWYQGIEMFVGMRRLGKEVYLVDYNNDVHNPASRANQKDIADKMQAFFDNKLKGAPEPDWMTHGIPAKDKGKDQVNMGPAMQAGVPTPGVRPPPRR